MEEMDSNTLLKKINITLEKRVNGYLEEQGVTISQWKCLQYIYDHGGKNVYLKDIQEYFGVSKPTMTGILKRLSIRGYVYLEKADYSPNSKDVTLTPEGQKICETGKEKKRIVDGMLTQSLSPEEAETFRALLEKIYRGMEEK